MKQKKTKQNKTRQDKTEGRGEVMDHLRGLQDPNELLWSACVYTVARATGMTGRGREEKEEFKKWGGRHIICSVFVLKSYVTHSQQLCY